MHKTVSTTNTLDNNITVSTDTLSKLLDCGRATAIKIGTEADAKIKIGKRVLWNTEKIRGYLNTK